VHTIKTAVALAFVGGVITCLSAAPAKAADTAVKCDKPVSWAITGVEQALPNFTIFCSGGSSAGNIVYFSYKATGVTATFGLLLATVAGNHAIQTNDGAITIYSNLSDLSGSAWGCGTANCRIIDQLLAD
jgi:hypothetical protein